MHCALNVLRLECPKQLHNKRALNVDQNISLSFDMSNLPTHHYMRNDDIDGIYQPHEDYLLFSE